MNYFMQERIVEERISRGKKNTPQKFFKLRQVDVNLDNKKGGFIFFF
jgi:hypothetical protein